MARRLSRHLPQIHMASMHVPEMSAMVSDLYHASYFREEAEKDVSVNPTGPSTSFDPEEPYAKKYVHRGGSFLCHQSYCKGYRITARMKTCPDTSSNHLGFRCVKSCEAGSQEKKSRE